MTIAPVDVLVDTVALFTAMVEEVVSAPERLRPVKVPSEVTPGWAALTERTIPAVLVSPAPTVVNGSNAAVAAAVVI